MNAKGHALSDQEMFPALEKCYRRMKKRRMTKVFPKWIGHIADIGGETPGAEAWYGLMVHKIDAGYQSQAFSSLADTLEDAHRSIRDDLLESLECNVFDDSSIDILKEKVKVQRESISCMCRYDCYETNYLLLTLGDDTVSKEFWSSVQEKYPALSTGCDDWLDTEEELKAAADKSLDEYEDTILMQSRLISMLSADLYEMEQIIVNGNLEALTEPAYLMSGLPELLPLPSWYSPETTGYLSVILAEDGSVTYPESGDNLADANYGIYIQVEGVSEEDITFAPVWYIRLQ